MAIMVGTITLIVTASRSVTSSTSPGSNDATKVVTPPAHGAASNAPSELSWNIGV